MPITIVGLGPGDPELLTLAGRRILEQAPIVFLRTSKHPGTDSLPAGPRYESFDSLYDTLDSFEAVYGAIHDRLIAAAVGDTEVVYAVPGDPLIAEATVRALLAAQRNGGPTVRIVSGVSFLEPVCRTLGIDPFEQGLQLADALDPVTDPARPVLFAQVHGRRVASHLKLALLELYPPDHRVTLVGAAGVAGEEGSEELPLAELDRNDHAGHLSTLFVPALSLEQNTRSFSGVRGIVHRLYAPGGCPWDREQTHASLKQHLLEETYEVLQALDDGDPHALAEELGDVLLQIALHTEIADEAGDFGYADVFNAITTKLIRRHPHVFGDVSAASAAEVAVNWQKIKESEKAARASGTGDEAPESLLAGVPTAMPSLAYAQAVQDRAAAVGFDWPRVDDVIEKLLEEVAELRQAETHADKLDEFGDILFVLANLARWLKIDAEEAGRFAGRKFARRFAGVERLAHGQGRRLSEMTLTEMDALWDDVKAGERAAADE
ncbi:MAG: bifunctional methyltransferase/pyrophosphohydrolase YabN [Dehalococcoidia bacterium]